MAGEKELVPIRVVKFWEQYRMGADGEQVAVDMVEYASVGGAKYGTTVVAVKRLVARGPVDQDNLAGMFALKRWQMIEPLYNAWKENREVPETGTPLAAWPGITQDQAEAFRNAGMRTLEDIVTASEGVIQRVPVPSPLRLQKQAKAFIENQDAAAASKMLETATSELASMKEQQEEMKRIIIEQQAALEAAQEEKKPPAPATKGRGSKAA